MLTLANQDISPILIRTGEDVRVRDGPSSISRSSSGNLHRLRLKSRDEQKPSMSHLGPSTSPYLLDIAPGSSGLDIESRSSGSMSDVSRSGRVHDGPSSISRSSSGSLHRLRVKSRDEQESSMSHLGPSTSPYLLDIAPGSSGLGIESGSSGSMSDVSRGGHHSRSLTVGDIRLSHLDISSPGSTSGLSSIEKEGCSIATMHSSLVPASLGPREPSSRGVGRSQSHIQPGATRGVRRYHSTSSAAGGADTPKSPTRRFGGKPSKNKDGIMKPIGKSKSGLASLFGGGIPKKTKKSKSRKEEGVPSRGAGLHAARKKEPPLF